MVKRAELDDTVHYNGKKKRVVGVEYPLADSEGKFNKLIVIDIDTGIVETYMENEVEVLSSFEASNAAE